MQITNLFIPIYRVFFGCQLIILDLFRRVPAKKVISGADWTIQYGVYGASHLYVLHQNNATIN